MTKPEDTEFGYQVTEKPTISRKPVDVFCEDCGGHNIVAPWWCVWDSDKQKWVADEWNDSTEAWCNDCDCECQIGEKPRGT